MKNILIVGATSAIAQETARLLAGRGDRLFLSGRNGEKLESVARDLQVRGAAQVGCLAVDVNDIHGHDEMMRRALEFLGGLDIVFLAQGSLGDQRAGQQNFVYALGELTTNFLSVASLLTIAANYFESQGRGCIAVISSVAGDRGRKSNYIYGTAKGAVAIFLQGLRNRLHEKGVAVITIKPGLVDTPMTSHLPKNFLFTTPRSIADGIVAAIDKGKDVVYLPCYWRYVMMMLRAVPERYFKSLDL